MLSSRGNNKSSAGNKRFALHTATMKAKMSVSEVYLRTIHATVMLSQNILKLMVRISGLSVFVQ